MHSTWQNCHSISIPIILSLILYAITVQRTQNVWMFCCVCTTTSALFIRNAYWEIIQSFLHIEFCIKSLCRRKCILNFIQKPTFSHQFGVEGTFARYTLKHTVLSSQVAQMKWEIYQRARQKCLNEFIPWSINAVWFCCLSVCWNRQMPPIWCFQNFVHRKNLLVSSLHTIVEIWNNQTKHNLQAIETKLRRALALKLFNIALGVRRIEENAKEKKRERLTAEELRSRRRKRQITEQKSLFFSPTIRVTYEFVHIS